MNSKYFSFLIIILLVSGCFNFQKHDVTAPEEPHYKLSGKTVDIDTNEPLPNIIVILDADSVISDSLGIYEFPRVKSGPHGILAVREEHVVFNYELMMPLSERVFDIELPKLIFAQTMGATVTSFTTGICWKYETLATLDFLSPTREKPYYEFLVHAGNTTGNFTQIYSLKNNKSPAIQCYGLEHFLSSYWTCIHLGHATTRLQEITKSETFGHQFDYPYYILDIAYDGTNLWFCNGRSKIIKAENLNGPFVEYFAPGSSISGIACHQSTFWLSDTEKNLIYKLNAEMEVVATYKSVADRMFDPELYLYAISQLACDSQGSLWGIGSSFPTRRFFKLVIK